ncbi:hypothetical protein V3391_06440 [Luteimonas sp. SMYT11W]|uniref:Uncharacterized protein n=1 Tax=Luteimonas flava TaxID=3115822 RepID=A0ABU7WEC3_9GAMM
MTPEEISDVVRRMDDHAMQFDRQKGTFRQFAKEQRAISQVLTDYGDTGQANSKLAWDAFNFACAGADTDGLYLHVEDLTLDHTPADQQAFLKIDRTTHKPLAEMTEVELLAFGRLLSNDLTSWIETFNYRGKTYREFWDQYAAEASQLEALARFERAPAQVREMASAVREIPLDKHYDPARLIPPRSLDDPIFDLAAAR